MAGVCPPKVLIVYGCGSKFSWIKVKSASETVYESYNFSLKLLGMLSKQLA